MSLINYISDTETLPDQAVHIYGLLMATVVCYDGGHSFMEGERIRHDILQAMLEKANQGRIEVFAYEPHKVLPATFIPDRMEQISHDAFRDHPSNAKVL